MRNRVRSAYTLNEMLIVVALIGAFTAMAFPALRKPLAKHQLRAAAKQLRAELARTRLEAIESGETLQFRFVPGGNSYRVERPDAAQREERAEDDDSSMFGGLDDSFRTSQDQVGSLIETEASNAAEAEENEPEELPEDIRFAVSEQTEGLEDAELGVDEASTASNLLERSEDSDDLDLLEFEDWSEPIVFYPNGRTSNAVVQLVGDRDYRVRLTLRGVTGTIFVSHLERPPEDDLEADAAPQPARVARRPGRSTDRSQRSPSQSLFRGSIHGISTSRAPAD
ncbi:MAG: Tfp pilus assembly protein FimT/FimU [Pirellulaceae bacterium]